MTAPTYPQAEPTFNLDDYGEKESITHTVSGRVCAARAPGPLELNVMRPHKARCRRTVSVSK